MRILAVAALGSLLLATPALADRGGHAPIRAPRVLQSDHIAFTLPGGVWKQKVGALEGNPAFGRYGLDVKLANGSTCNLIADVVGNASKRPLVARGDTVALRPFSQFPDTLHVTSRGRHGAVRWWAGTLENLDAAAGGTQRLPARLRRNGNAYLNYGVRINHPRPREADPCGATARRAGARIARTIARTMHVADGPPVSRPPYESS
ncbi:MAG: hypothetical protein LC685_04820 [Actinobacteria bacterium]|nr:hypothetical protein [Actinomycetota bacterium]